jgi:cell division septum initiation protein DivIVA
MSVNHEDIIATLRNNFKKIITLYEKKKEENLDLRTENEQLKKQVSEYKKQNEELRLNKNNTNLASAFIEASGSNHNAKIQVNRIVREIDKCIALLNK